METLLPTIETRPSKWRGVRLVLIVGFFGVVAFGAFRWLEQRGSNSLESIRQRIAEQENRLKMETADVLRLLSAEDRKSLAHVALSTRVLERMVEPFKGVVLTEPKTGAQITITEVNLKCDQGFARVTAKATAQIQDYRAAFKGSAALVHAIRENGVSLRLVILGLEPEGELPSALKTIVSAEATTRLNEQLKEFSAPIPREFVFKPEIKPMDDFTAKMPNGSVTLRAIIPTPPPLTIYWRPVSAFFYKDGFHALGQIATDPLTEPIKRGETGKALSEPEIADILKPWALEPGQDYAARLPSKPVLDLVAGLNALPPAQRTVSVAGVKSDGHILDKTGGLPLGNGFQSWLEGAERLKVSGILSNLRPEWIPGKGVAITGAVSADGSVQVHVHGNPPRIKKRISIGPFSWKVIDVEVGGGVGSSVGASASARSDDVRAMLSYLDDEKVFTIRLTGPEKVDARVNIGGVPDELEKLLKLGFPIHLPIQKDLYRFKLPAVLNEHVSISMPKEADGGKKQIPIAIEPSSVRFTDEALELRGHLPGAP